MTIIETIYKDFSDWDTSTQETIIDKNRYFNVEDVKWYDHIICQFKEIGGKVGIDIDKIYFTGFCSQGDGACFTGSYSYQKGALRTIKTEYPEWKELHKIVQNLQALQRRYCYLLNSRVSHHGHYYHENCAYVTTDHNNDYDISGDTQDEMTDILRDFMRLIYSTLEKEHDHLTSDEALRKYFKESDYQFDEDGGLL